MGRFHTFIGNGGALRPFLFGWKIAETAFWYKTESLIRAAAAAGLEKQQIKQHGKVVEKDQVPILAHAGAEQRVQVHTACSPGEDPLPKRSHFKRPG